MSSIPGDFAINGCRCADSECEHRQEIIPELPPKKADRVKGQIYINKKGKKGIWSGRALRYSCWQDGCDKQSAFNYEGQKIGIYCAVHKKDTMVDVKNKRCCQDGCDKFPIYNYEGQILSLYCSVHKKDTMVDVKNRRCCQDGCNKQSNFNYEGQKNGLYCRLHKKDTMVDVMHKRCYQKGCNKHPHFNYEGQTKGIYCVDHKEDTMVDVKNKRCCQDGCDKQPTFNYEGQKNGLYCRVHKKDNMVDVINKRCSQDGCQTSANSKYDGYCMPCFINNPLNANKPAHRNYKTKEKEVALAITQRYPDATWILDKRIQDGCSARRPDVRLDLGYHVLMIEVDENRHDNYDCSCENKRLMQLAQDICHRNMVVIRFNPDAYETLKGKRIPSCWKLNKLGVVHIPKDQQNAWNNRIQQLLDTIQYWIENKSEKQIEIVELFYG